MNPMGRYQTLLCALLVLVVAGCGSTGQTGLFPGPVWLPEIETLKVPSGSFSHGDTAEFEVVWTGGRSPFTVFWDFGDGGEPNEIESGAFEQHQAISVTLVNAGTVPQRYEGTVRIVDQTNNTVSGTFNFTVDPAPEPEAPVDEEPGEGEEPPVDGEEPPVDGEEPPVDGEEPPVDGEEPPVDGEEPPVDGEEPPVDGEEPPVDGEEPPVDNEEPPVVVDPPPPPI